MAELTRTTVAALLAALMATGAYAQEAPADDSAAEDTAQTEAEVPAQEQTGPATTEEALGLSMGEDTSEQVGQTYTREEHGDWEVRCVRTESGADPCQLYQLLQDQNANSVAEISVFPLPAGGQAAAGATIITPLETLLTAQISLRIDSSEAKQYPFSFCSTIGCFSRVGFTENDLSTFRRGASATVTIRPAAAPDQTVDLRISLSGFTAGYEAVTNANAAALQQSQE